MRLVPHAAKMESSIKDYLEHPISIVAGDSIASSGHIVEAVWSFGDVHIWGPGPSSQCCMWQESSLSQIKGAGLKLVYWSPKFFMPHGHMIKRTGTNANIHELQTLLSYKALDHKSCTHQTMHANYTTFKVTDEAVHVPHSAQ